MAMQADMHSRVRVQLLEKSFHCLLSGEHAAVRDGRLQQEKAELSARQTQNSCAQDSMLTTRATQP